MEKAKASPCHHHKAKLLQNAFSLFKGLPGHRKASGVPQIRFRVVTWCCKSSRGEEHVLDAHPKLSGKTAMPFKKRKL